MIRISSKREGFRRCGVAHPKEPVEYPDDKFSKEEIAVLEAEPTLTVEYTEDPVIAETPAPEDMTVAALKGLLNKLKVSYDSSAKKAVLIDLVKANTGEPPRQANGGQAAEE